MNEQSTDLELLRAFLREGNQSAFSTLARRHLNLVYATAWRKTGDAGAAQEVAQNVFLVLARKGWQFASDDSLPAWLHRTALLESRHWLRGELRRKRRESVAAELGTTMKTPDEQLALRALIPLLDEALLSLREKDRTALLLRFYETRSLREVGASLGLTEDAAQKRVAGALEKLSGFFQRRGYKSATVAVTVAALQHTAEAAPVAVVSSVLHAAAQATPPVLGILGLAARLASLTRLQTTTVCLLVAAVPVAWEWQALSRSERESSRLRMQVTSTQIDLTDLETELARWRRTSLQVESSLAAVAESARQTSQSAQELSQWKQRLRAKLLGDDYQWPEDAAFVRIPKSVVSLLEPHQPITTAGVLSRNARELLGLAPAEREQVEAALQRHFNAMDQMIEAALVQTNRATRFQVPDQALDSAVWRVPALGDQANTQAEELRQTLKTTLGEDRWALAQRQIGNIAGKRLFSLEADQKPQEVVAFLREQDGHINITYGWSSDGASYSSGGNALDMFLPATDPRATEATSAEAWEMVSGFGLPPALSRRLYDWLQQQAVRRVGKDAR